MCGLVMGAIKSQNGFFAGDIKAFEEMLYIDALRGPDSTGMACFYSNGEMQLIKDVLEAADFRYTTEYNQAIAKLIKNGKAVVGHNRKKTSGKIDVESAHPFAINNRYLFAHNGTLHNEVSLQKKLEDTVVLQSNVDSEVLGNLICPTNGDLEKLGEVLGGVFGAYACIWMDQVEEKLYLVRNKERPLFLVETSIGYFAASEPGFLYAALNRNRLKVDSCIEIDADCLYTIDISEKTMSLVKEPITIKKAMPVQTGKTNGKGDGATKAHTFSKNISGWVSKNEYKRFSRKYLGSIGSFFIDDYVERSVGEWQSGWWVWGEHIETYEIPHQCRGVMRAMPEQELVAMYAGTTVFGRISQITRDETTGMPIMVMEHVSDTRNGVMLKERMDHDTTVH